MYKCKHCSKEFTRKYGLDCHLYKNKIKCYEKKKYEIFINNKKMFSCKECDKVYTRKQHLDNHIYKNHAIPVEKDKISSLELKIKQLEEKIADNKSINININNTNNNTNNISGDLNNINIEKLDVNAYSYENDSYIPENILDECVNNPFEGVVKLTKMINFNEEHPENFNMYMNNKNKKEISFFNNNKWIKRDKKSALSFIFNTQTDRIGEHLDNNPEKFQNDKAFIENILRVILEIETHDTKMNNNEHYRNLVGNIFKIIEDNNDKVIKRLKNKIIKIKNKDYQLNYKNKKHPICVPLYLEPTKITD